MNPVVAFLRAHRWARRGLSVLSVGLLITAVGLLGYPFYTNLVQDRLQHKLDRSLASADLRRRYVSRSLSDGDALTRIRIPKIGLDVVVVEGTSASALRAGAGHYPQTPLPCEDGNVGIAGHRTTYGKPFANIDRLEPGDTIILETPVGSCTYEVAAPLASAKEKGPGYWVTSPDDFSVVANDPSQHLLTLTACHPKGSASHRIIVRAVMSKGSQSQA